MYDKMESGSTQYRRCRTLLVLSWIVVGSSSCSESTDATHDREGQRPPIRIVALGDSTTEAGWEGNASHVYSERLVGELETFGIRVDVINAGISNTTSLQALARLDSDVLSHDPDYVIVQFGINDSWIDAYRGRTEPRLTPQEYVDCMGAIIDTLRDAGAHVILMTPNPMRWSQMYGEELRDPSLGFDFDDPRGINRLLDIYTARLRDLAREKDVTLIDVFANFEAYDRVDGQSIHDLLIPGDELHPSDAGHALIAKWLAEELVDLLQAQAVDAE